MPKPLPPTARSDSYIQTGETYYVYEVGAFRALECTGALGYGAPMYRHPDGRETTRRYFGTEVLSAPDLSWFRGVLAQCGTDIGHLRAIARGGNEDVSYLLLWIDSMLLPLERARLGKALFLGIPGAGHADAGDHLTPQQVLNALSVAV